MAEEKDIADLFKRMESAPGFKEKLACLSKGKPGSPVAFEHIHPAAAPFLVGLVGDAFARESEAARIWVVAPHLKAQELIVSELPVWMRGGKGRGGRRTEILFLPEQEEAVGEGIISDPEIAAERLAILHRLSAPAEGVQVVVLTREALRQAAPREDSLSDDSKELRVGGVLDIESFGEELTQAGFERVTQVISRNQWTRRGGILDFFPPQAGHPIRVELFGDEIDSLREFDIDTQTSVKRRERIGYLLAEPEGDKPLSTWIGGEDLVISTQQADVEADVLFTEGTFGVTEEEDFECAMYGEPLGLFDAGDFVIQQVRRQRVTAQLLEWKRSRWKVVLMFANKGEERRFCEILTQSQPGEEDVEAPEGETKLPKEWSKVKFMLAPVSRGFTAPAAKLAVLSSEELFGRYGTAAARRYANREDKARQRRAQSSLSEFHAGDLVVHLQYGIGKYLRIELDDKGNEQMVIEYKDKVLLRIPINQSHLVSRYVGLGKKSPELSKIGDSRWSRSRKTAEKSINDYAAHLLNVEAERETRKGYAHPPDTRWMWEFENSFPYRETPDQLRAINQTKQDMESNRPMDRLICGDVGFGKTEVAIRAAFKAVMGGKQAVLLAPTTVLAEQHCRTFRQRMSEYPVRIDLLSRFRSQAEQRNTLQGLADGSVDIVIGTHRLISDDVVLKDPGIVIIDEEQRFGVKHKEKFKERFRSLDILTLSATPIPRTLYLSLMGARDMSTIDTPPPNRLPVHTSISAYDERLIKTAIEKELARGGQVYFLHNRVKTIDMVRKRLEELVPQAKIVVGHGQMDKSDLEDVMHSFVKGEADVLLATTIIESGIDIPNANTIIIDRADRFGLADLYQLRGRVGRSGHQAYAYLLLPRKEMSTGDARKRINAIKQYTELGSGFKIAMRDLEIRGAGNLLGTQQSGHIAAIGFDLYCQLLRQSIERAQGKRTSERIDCHLKADFLIWGEAQSIQATEDGLGRATVGAYFPSPYLPEPALRIAAYKDMAKANSLRELDELASIWKDRFGPLPEPVNNLLICHKIKTLGSMAKISHVEIKGDRLMLTRNGNYILLANKVFPKLKSGVAKEKLEEALEMLKSL